MYSASWRCCGIFSEKDSVSAGLQSRPQHLQLRLEHGDVFFFGRQLSAQVAFQPRRKFARQLAEMMACTTFHFERRLGTILHSRRRSTDGAE
jgi:hypothetical protein